MMTKDHSRELAAAMSLGLAERWRYRRALREGGGWLARHHGIFFVLAILVGLAVVTAHVISADGLAFLQDHPFFVVFLIVVCALYGRDYLASRLVWKLDREVARLKGEQRAERG